MLALSAALLLAAAPAAAGPLPPAEALYAELDALLGLAPARAVTEPLAALRAIRLALRRYYADTGGRYPASPEALIPGYLPALPAPELPGHPGTAAVKLPEGREHDGDISGAVTDAGGWLYFAGAGSAQRGLLALNCSHLSPEGQEYFKY